MTVKLTLPAAQLRDLFAPVLPLAGTDDALPVLTTIRFAGHGATLTAAATDRFRAGISRVVLELDDDQAPPDPFAINVPARAVRHVLATFKPGRRGEQRTVTLDVDPGDVVKHPTGAFVNRTASITVEGATTYGWHTTATIDGFDPRTEFPKLWSLVAEANTPSDHPTSLVRLNAKLLAGFRAATLGNDAAEPLVFTFPAAPPKPVGIACGTHFLGALMPRRAFDEPTSGAVETTWLAELFKDPA